MAALEPAWLRTESPLGQWRLLLFQMPLQFTSNNSGLCSPQVEPGSTFQLSVLCLCGQGIPLWLQEHPASQQVSWECLSWETALDSDVSLPGSLHSSLPGPVLRIVRLPVQSHTAVTTGTRSMVHIALPPPKLGKHLVLKEAEPGAHSPSPFFEPSTPPNCCTWGPL